MSDEPFDPLADTTDDDYGGNEGDVTEEDDEELEDVDGELDETDIDDAEMADADA